MRFFARGKLRLTLGYVSKLTSYSNRYTIGINLVVEIKILSSAFRHGISEKEILSLLAYDSNRAIFEIHEDEYGNLQEMIVGFSQNGKLLEIALKYTATNDVIFHANKASFKYRRLFRSKNR